TRAFDDVICETVQRDSIDTVLNLAAGLDARPYRLPLPSELRWIEVDLPGILAEKTKLLAGERPALAEELRQALPDSRWLLDNVAPDVLARLKKNWDARLKPGNATMKFAPTNGLRFFE